MTLTEQTAQPTPQVLLVGEKDRKRLLEVYVKRSLSLNDGSQALYRQRRQQGKWVTRDPRDKRDRKHSSDSSLHLSPSDSADDLSKHEALSKSQTMKKTQVTREQPDHKSKRWRKNSAISRNNGSSASCKSDSKPLKWFSHFEKDKRDGKQQSKASKTEFGDSTHETFLLPPLPNQIPISTEAKKPKEGKKKKKSSIWKRVLGWFSKGNSDKQEVQDEEDDEHEEALPPPPTPSVSCLPLSEVLSSGEVITWKKRRQMHRKTSLKRRSGDIGLDKATGRPLTLDLFTVDHKPMVKSIEEVEPTNFYYEKVSEELHKIVHEVKNSPLEDNRIFCDTVQPTDPTGMPMSQEEVVERIIALIKQQGDVIDSKLKENSTVSSYFSTLSYSSFQQLADQYVQSGVPEQKSQPLVVAPELVKFAFTLDFTARLAGLSRHAPGHILGFGNQYLKDRFTHLSETHPHICDITEEKTESKESTNKEVKEHLFEEK
ncbi:uncharacterized protein LOC113581558 [Electrophorus electricus]|uniref:uncharacterized protein LOC113581558 n=1 Tax=Electrophorus electricus TaxID=8005 RepID=UPI0015D04525|nr:uncharacterized protein LOC113581558 [Electrophorus electricus]